MLNRYECYHGDQKDIFPLQLLEEGELLHLSDGCTESESVMETLVWGKFWFG